MKREKYNAYMLWTHETGRTPEEAIEKLRRMYPEDYNKGAEIKVFKILKNGEEEEVEKWK